MFKYLIADYILGYCLSTDYPFSAKEIGEELHVPVQSVSRIMKELVKMKAHWFEVLEEPSSGYFTVVRKKEYDEEMILWLTKGSSRNHYQLAELRLRGDKLIPARTTQQKLQFALTILAAIIKFCLIMIIRQYKRNKDILIRYIYLLRNRISRTTKANK